MFGIKLVLVNCIGLLLLGISAPFIRMAPRTYWLDTVWTILALIFITFGDIGIIIAIFQGIFAFLQWLF